MNFLSTLFICLVTLTIHPCGLVPRRQVTFCSFTTKNPSKCSVISDENTIDDTSSPVVFLIHGWKGQLWYRGLRNALLARFQPITIIQVYWPRPASWFYPFSAFATDEIGKIIADFIIHQKISSENIQIYGHSLGAHVAGSTGRYLQAQSLTLPLITALDPAGPLYALIPIFEGVRLRKTDAQVVVALHTDPWLLGTGVPLGTVDVYVNGFPLIQPGCPSSRNWLLCSHKRSYQYLVDALLHPGTLVATRCDSYELFEANGCRDGTRVDLGGGRFGVEDAGVYFVDTKAKRPYGLGDGR